MRPVAYLFCPQCHEERMYVLYDEPWDENESQCVTCGHSFGYCVQVGQEIINGTPVPTAKPKPVLDPDVLLAGIRKLQAETLRRLSERHGEPVVRATKQLQDGLAEMDRQRRAQLLGGMLPMRK